MEREQHFGPWWRNPYLVILALTLGFLTFSEIAPFFSNHFRFFHQVVPKLAINSINVAVSCLGALIMYLVLIPAPKSERWFVLGTGLALEAWLIFIRSHFIGPWGQILNLGVGFFPSVVLALVWRWWQHYRHHESAAAQRTAEVMGLCSAMPILYIFGSTINLSESRVYDAMLLAADSMFGTQISFYVSQALTANLGIRIFGYIAYFYLALFMQMAQLITYARSHDESTSNVQPAVIPAFLFIVTALLGTASYQYLPAIGTEAFCGTAIYPHGPIPIVESIPKPLSAPPFLERNCMPSLHLTWILCAFFAVCNLKKIYKYLGTVIVISVWLSAFSVGHHWVSDFIGALPFTAFCLGLTSVKAPRKWRLWATLYCGPAYCAFVYIIKNHIVWVMEHQALYLVLIALMALSAWFICWKLLPAEQEKNVSA